VTGVSAASALRKAGQALLVWTMAAAVLWFVWPPVLSLPQLWMLAAVSALANVFQPAYSLFERSRTPYDRHTAAQIVWTVYLTQVAALTELVLRRRASVPLDALTWVAFGAMLAGLGLRTWAVLLLGRFFTWNIEIQPGQGIVRSGPYRLIRHPSYTGALVTFVASCVLLRSWIAAVLALVALTLAFWRRIRYEEKLLRVAFPEYDEYASHTGMLLPRLH
jgi:protein-S-isoprenylcysteine O-methyltransferase